METVNVICESSFPLTITFLIGSPSPEEQFSKPLLAAENLDTPGSANHADDAITDNDEAQMLDIVLDMAEKAEGRYSQHLKALNEMHAAMIARSDNM